MIVGVPTSKASAAGRIYGHVGIYIGDGLIRHNVGKIETITFEEWVDTFYINDTYPVKWGFPPSSEK